jgi:DNA-binding MltR family transcriptional regulator
LSGYIPVFGKIIATNKLRNYLITEKKIEDIEYINNIKEEFNLVTSAYQFSVDNDTIGKFQQILLNNLLSLWVKNIILLLYN